MDENADLSDLLPSSEELVAEIYRLLDELEKRLENENGNEKISRYWRTSDKDILKTPKLDKQISELFDG